MFPFGKQFSESTKSKLTFISRRRSNVIIATKEILLTIYEAAP